MINHLFGVVLGDFELAFTSDPVLTFSSAFWVRSVH